MARLSLITSIQIARKYEVVMTFSQTQKADTVASIYKQLPLNL